MAKDTNEVLREYKEDRGWAFYNNNKQFFSEEEKREKRVVEPLPITEDDYRILMPLLARYGLSSPSLEEKETLFSLLEKLGVDEFSSLSEMYFELQRRARYGNHFSDVPIGNLEAILFSNDIPFDKGFSR